MHLQEKNDLSMVSEQLAVDRIKAECDHLNLDPNWALAEFRDDFEDIANGTLSQRGLRFALRTVAVMQGLIN